MGEKEYDEKRNDEKREEKEQDEILRREINRRKKERCKRRGTEIHENDENKHKRRKIDDGKYKTVIQSTKHEKNKPKVRSVQLEKTLNFRINFSVPTSTRERVNYFNGGGKVGIP